MSRNGYNGAERAQCVTLCLEGHGKTAVRRFFTIITPKHLLLDRIYGIGVKTIDNEDLMLIEVETDARKPVMRGVLD